MANGLRYKYNNIHLQNTKDPSRVFRQRVMLACVDINAGYGLPGNFFRRKEPQDPYRVIVCCQ
jgi:hypothetical protein